MMISEAIIFLYAVPENKLKNEHLRYDKDWEEAFENIYGLTLPGGSVGITDLVSHETRTVQSLMWKRYYGYQRRMQDVQTVQAVSPNART